MGHEARLRPAGAVAEAEDHHGQVDVSDEARNSIVHRSHREQRAGPLLGLHAPGGNKTEHRQALLRAGHQQLAELLGAGHIEGACLESNIGNHDPAAKGAALPL